MTRIGSVLRRAGAVAAATGLLAAGGCGGSTSGDGGSPAAADPSGEQALPGIKEFGLAEEEFVAHIDRTQALIAQCMARAGFEYIPVDVETIEAAQARVRSDPGYTRRSYKEKLGLGVTTRFDNPVRDTGLGPNLRIWRSLPPADQEAYSRTLFGEDPNADFVFDFDEEDFSGAGGYTGEAVSKVFTKPQLKGTYVNPKDILVESDPRIIEANKRWAECMHDAGYEYEEDQDEIIEEYQDRLDELTEGEDPDHADWRAAPRAAPAVATGDQGLPRRPGMPDQAHRRRLPRGGDRGVRPAGQRLRLSPRTPF